MKWKNPLVWLLGLSLVACQSNETPSTDPMPAEEKRLRAAIAESPDSMLLREELIQYFRDNANYFAALQAADSALLRDTASARLWDIKAVLHYENRDTLAAIRSLEKAIDIDPLPEYIISLGTAYAETRNPLALELADALLMSPMARADIQAGFIKGLYYNHTKDYDRAVRIFSDIIQRDYTNLMAYREKAIALLESGKAAEAIPVLQTAIEVQSSYEEGYYWLGRCHEQLKQTRQAIAAYQQALQLDPGYVEAQDALGRLGAR